MNPWPPALFLRHPARPWALDLTAMAVEVRDLEALDWERAFADMRALEEGAVANPDEQRQVGHYWLRNPQLAPTVGQAAAIGEMLQDVSSFVTAVRSGSVTAPDGERFTDVLHVGIGGSVLGPELVVRAVVGQGEGLALHFLDNTDPDGIERVLRQLRDRLRTTLVIVVSKSGSTPETMNAYQLVREAIASQGLEVARQLVAITGADSILDELAINEGWLARFPMWSWVGGRTSVTAAVGLIPAGLAGVDIQAFLDGAREMDQWTRNEEVVANPAALLAGAWHCAGKGHGERAMVVLPYSDRLVMLSRYLQQLVMESLGKELDLTGNPVEQGLTVYGNKGSTDQHAYVQQLRDGRNDFFVQFVQVLDDGIGSGREVAPGANAGDFLQGFLLGTRRALSDRDRPSMTLTLPTVDAFEIGAVVALFERAVGLYASLIGINAYHQPGVEAGKRAAKEILSLSSRLRAALNGRPQSLEQLAASVDAAPVEAWYVLERLAATARVVRDEGGYRLPGVHDA